MIHTQFHKIDTKVYAKWKIIASPNIITVVFNDLVNLRSLGSSPNVFFFCKSTILYTSIGDVASSIFPIYMIIYTDVFTIHWEVKHEVFPFLCSQETLIGLRLIFFSPQVFLLHYVHSKWFWGIWLLPEVYTTVVFNIPISLDWSPLL